MQWWRDLTCVYIISFNTLYNFNILPNKPTKQKTFLYFDLFIFFKTWILTTTLHIVSQSDMLSIENCYNVIHKSKSDDKSTEY